MAAVGHQNFISHTVASLSSMLWLQVFFGSVLLGDSYGLGFRVDGGNNNVACLISRRNFVFAGGVQPSFFRE